MTRVESTPFLRIDPARVRAERWVDSRTGAQLPAAGLDGWDPSVELQLEREMAIDAAAARRDAGLAASDRLTCAATWYCPITTMRGAGSRVEVVGDQATLRLSLTVPGFELAGRVILRTGVVLVAREAGDEPLAALIPGSVLWQDSTVLPVEGAGSRFPMEWLEFGGTGWLPNGAGWYLEWSPDEPEAPALGAIRLYLNESHPSVRAAVMANPPQPHQKVIRDAIQFDVARTLILGALRADPAVWDEAAGDPASVASVVNRLIRVVFPGESIQGLRHREAVTPERLEARMQDGLRLFRRVYF